MKTQSKYLLIYLLLATLLLTATSVSALSRETQIPQPDSQQWFDTSQSGIDIELVRQFGGSVHSSAVRGDYAYAGIGPNLVILNVADPAQPVSAGQT
ncbi:MAG: hypothetical protein GY764_00885, partial [Halieaceae bacterium]|nr:hypothetical protein [Halieaceae bacterium]